MIRLTILWFVVVGLCVYSWKDWFKSLCGLIVFMAVIDRPEVPRSLFGIQGLSPWNFIFLNVMAAWAMRRRAEGLVWDLPRHATVLLILYLGVILVGFTRMIVDRSLVPNSLGFLWSEHLINTLKWVIPGLLMFHGCRSIQRLRLAVVCVLLMYVVLALQVIRLMPPSYAMSGEVMQRRAVRILDREIGYHRVNLSMMLAGASWAVYASRPLAPHAAYRLLILGAAMTTAFAQALTGGRMGYATWGVVGMLLALIRWRWQLVLIPLVAALIGIATPGVVDRVLQGFSQDDLLDVESMDQYEVTAGRNMIWPHVIEKIGGAPTFGYGREAMFRTGLVDFSINELGEVFGHPHNAYLEMLLDNGWVGLAIVVSFYGVVLWHSLRLFRNTRSAVSTAIGGMSAALTLALVVAGGGSQTFYPREGNVGMWCAIGLMFRVKRDGGRLFESSVLPAGQVTAVKTPVAVRPWQPPSTRRRSLPQLKEHRGTGTPRTSDDRRPIAGTEGPRQGPRSRLRISQ